MTDAQRHTDDTSERLFLGVAEQLSHTFLQLARLSEAPLASDKVSAQAQWATVHDVSDAAVRLVDSYALHVRLQQHLREPELEPVTVSSLFYEATQQLAPLAAQYGVELELAELPRLAPVMSDPVVLQAALVSLGQVFVAAEAAREEGERLRFMAHHSRYGIIAGIYTTNHELSADAFRRARALYGRARQPYAKLGAGPAAGVFVADNLLHSVSSKLHVARYHKLTGLAATLPVCRQLQLV